MNRNIKNIIFDFGGVIINIDPRLTLDEFHKLGLTDFSGGESGWFVTDVLNRFETGIITETEFGNAVKSLLNPGTTNAMVDTAWNLTLLDIPPSRIALLKSLKKHYRLFLLSNTNSIHYDKYTKDFCDDFGFDFESLFEKAYWSFKAGLRKPDPEFFTMVLQENRLLPEETLFIDDTQEHTETARNLNINPIHLTGGTGITDLFKNNRLKDF
ncbi:MAG: HAD family phosphatase [Bacteroidales bacterium]|nr:HAD family phosphatase [Bacteroidales bacterium]